MQHSDGSGPLNEHVNVRSDNHTALVREIGCASTVLIKNNRTAETVRGLPLDMERIKSLAVIGMDAKMPNIDCGDLNECNDGVMTIG